MVSFVFVESTPIRHYLSHKDMEDTELLLKGGAVSRRQIFERFSSRSTI